MHQALETLFSASPPLIPKIEVLCYEALWAEAQGVTFKSLAQWLNGKLPSSFLSRIPQEKKDKIQKFLDCNQFFKYDVVLRETVDYPKKLSPLEIPLLYYSGELGLMESKCISIVGSRKATLRGLKAARIIAEGLAQNFVIVSGLATGVDTEAHKATIMAGGNPVTEERTPGLIPTSIL